MLTKYDKIGFCTKVSVLDEGRAFSSYVINMRGDKHIACQEAVGTVTVQSLLWLNPAWFTYAQDFMLH